MLLLLMLLLLVQMQVQGYTPAGLVCNHYLLVCIYLQYWLGWLLRINYFELVWSAE